MSNQQNSKKGESSSSAKKMAKTAEKKVEKVQKQIKEVKAAINVNPQKQKKKGSASTNLAKAVKAAAHAGLEWLWEEGWETIVSLTASFLLTDPVIRSQSRMVGAMATITAGTILYKFPISGTMFGDINDRLQKQLSLYTKYKFEDSQIKFKGAAGELVSGQIGIFVIPDPGLVITSTDPVSLSRLVRQYGGSVVKLTGHTSVNIPNVRVPLFVQPDPNAEPRFESQAVVYIVAMTDIDSSVPIGEFAIKYKVGMIEPANTGVTPRFDPCYAVQSYSIVDSTQGISTDSSDAFSIGASVNLFGKGGSYASAGRIYLYPGSYKASTNIRCSTSGASFSYLSFVWNYRIVDPITGAQLATSASQNMYNYSQSTAISYSHNLNWTFNVDRLVVLYYRFYNSSTVSAITVAAGSTNIETLSFYPLPKVAGSALLASGLDIRYQDLATPATQQDVNRNKEPSIKRRFSVGPSYADALGQLNTALQEAYSILSPFETFEDADRYILESEPGPLRTRLADLSYNLRKTLF